MRRSRQNTFDRSSAMKSSYPKLMQIVGDDFRHAPVLDKHPRLAHGNIASRARVTTPFNFP